MQGPWDCGLERVGRDCKLLVRMSQSRKELRHDSHDPTSQVDNRLVADY